MQQIALKINTKEPVELMKKVMKIIGIFNLQFETIPHHIRQELKEAKFGDYMDPVLRLLPVLNENIVDYQLNKPNSKSSLTGWMRVYHTNLNNAKAALQSVANKHPLEARAIIIKCGFRVKGN